MNTTKARRVRGRVRAQIDNRTWVVELSPAGIKVRRLRTHGRHVYRMSLPELVETATGQKLLPLTK